jgi:lysine 6-dehydrogenase
VPDSVPVQETLQVCFGRSDAQRLYDLSKANYPEATLRSGLSVTAGPNPSLNAAVLGAGGTIAPAIVRDLAASPEVGRMLLLDLDGERASAVAETHAPGKAIARGVDARDLDALSGALDGIDVLVNTASYRVNLEAMRACLQAGCNYLDLGGLYWMTARQLELREEFDRAGLLALLGIGSSPGKTNLMAQLAVGELGAGPGTIDCIEIAAAGRDLAARDDGFRPPYAIQTLLDELTLKPVVLRDGEPVEIEPLAPGGEVDFGEPIGVAQTIYTLHSELATFGRSFGCKGASFRLSLSPSVLSRLRELVGASPEHVTAAAREAMAPSNATVSVHLVTVTGGDGGRIAVRAVTEPHFGLGGSIVSTAAPAAASVRLLARGSLSATGAHPPEDVIDAEEMFAELRTRGCSFSVTR